MPSSFSPNLRIELISAGEQAGTWGTTTNTNLGTLVEDAIAGYEEVSVTSGSQALTYADGAADQSRNAMIELTTTTGANFAVYAPPSPKEYTIYNASSYTATIYNSTVIGNTTAAGDGVAIPAGKKMVVFTDGTHFSTIYAETAGSATTQSAGTNNTTIATTAFVQAALGSLVAIPTGVITLWSGSVGSVPAGWNICDGTNGTPDLRNRFVVGAGSAYAVAATGGSADAIVVSHTHTGTTGNQSADHTHTFSGTTSTGGSHTHDANSGVAGIGQGAPGPNSIQASAGSETTSSAGSHNHTYSGTTSGVSANHTHGFTTDSSGSSGTNANLPPYYALAYIMKL